MWKGLRITLLVRKSITGSETFADEYELFVKRYGLEWRDEGNR